MRVAVASGSGALVADATERVRPELRRLRVCFITLPPDQYSGATFHAIWLAQKLAHWNVDVEFLAFSRHARPSERIPQGFPVHYLKGGSVRFGEIVLWWNLLRFFRRNRRFDVVHAHFCGYLQSFVPVAARAAGMASLANVILQGVDLGPTGRFEAPIRNRLIRLYDRVVPISVETYREARSAGLAPGKLVQIPISVDSERFRATGDALRERLRAHYGLPLDRPVVAFVGALNARKNVVWLLDAWLARPERLTDAVLFLVGDAVGDPEGAEVRRAVQSRVERAGSSVHWLPFERQIERVYQASDALVLPSLAEGMPSVVLQAMASGLPVVATPTAGVTELLGRAGERGWLFDFNDKQGLWRILETVLLDEGRNSTLGHAARAHVLAHCSLDVVARRYRDLYVGLVETKRGRRR